MLTAQQEAEIRARHGKGWSLRVDSTAHAEVMALLSELDRLRESIHSRPEGDTRG